VRDLQQDAGAVAHTRIGADRAAMLEIAENLQPILDDLVRLVAFDVGDESDAAGVVLEARIVQTGGRPHLGTGGHVGIGNLCRHRSALGIRWRNSQRRLRLSRTKS